MPVKMKDSRRIDGIDVKVRCVFSSNVDWIGWPTTGDPLMLVRYSSGALYGYQGVSRQRAVAAAYAPSSGVYLAKRIKPNFKAVRINL